MSTVKISLNSFEKVRDFIKVTNGLDCDLDLISGRYVVDGKSVMGIFSLDLSKPINVNIITKQRELDYFPPELEQFII